MKLVAVVLNTLLPLQGSIIYSPSDMCKQCGNCITQRNNCGDIKYEKGFYICLAILGVILVISLVAWLLMRNKKEK